MKSKLELCLKIVAFLLIIISLIIVYLNPSVGYEVSIYKSTPFYFWIFLLCSYFIGFATLLYQLNYNNDNATTNNNKEWVTSALILITCNVIFLYLFIIKGYAFYGRADNLSHLGYVIDIYNSGYISEENIYPLVHILLSIISIFSNIPSTTVMKFLAGFCSILFIINIYLVTLVAFKKKTEVLITLASANILFFGSFFLEGYHISSVPNSITDFMYPLILYLYFKKSNVSYNILFIIILLAFPFFHPLSTISLLVVFLAFEFYNLIESGLKKPSSFSTRPLVILFVTFLVWISSFRMFNNTLWRISSFLIKEANNSPATDVAGIIDKMGFSAFELIEIILKLYGQNLLFLFISFVSIVLLIRNKDEYIGYVNLYKFGFAQVLLVVIFVILFLIPFGFNHYRWISYLSIFSIILSTVTLIKIQKKGLISLVIIIIFISAMTGVFNLYNSPYKSQPNQQITIAEFDGFEWFLKNKNPNLKIASVQSVSFYRFVDGISGVSTREARSDISNYTVTKKDSESILPDHFNYTKFENLGYSFSEDRYVHFSHYDLSLYTEVWPRLGRYTNDDFAQIENDSSIEKFYSNGDVNFYKVCSNIKR